MGSKQQIFMYKTCSKSVYVATCASSVSCGNYSTVTLLFKISENTSLFTPTVARYYRNSKNDTHEIQILKGLMSKGINHNHSNIIFLISTIHNNKMREHNFCLTFTIVLFTVILILIIFDITMKRL